ncbi:D-alanyl-D-alanine carboxypeptidase family protein [Gilvimarinus sp. SDUM040013]|uniref:serine-type D-Ala-D-Ala carboxypeptidase n=1 Tax=Gilvimarinus gilvus TaxID=3058038 RepID=A0ABU4RWK4_9GAMM|nr:D-alanyl-D-alanine carboxypeptidase family protein [Gilvimarinus sp. SDUM040013]MDO3385282.1 D-alanyl-D-alanine carboxypeptidase family protein [Gilvimarinus sp. SDUM040013]MDX6849265.1 D-alanyl-D-alanine carboxypeptidase family protein [Gilvimarinus sp. SDUM040013]
MLSKLFSFVAIFSLTVAVQAQQVLIPAPPQLAATAYLLVDADTGEVLVEHNADEQLPPASLTKMMTSYIVTNELEHNRLGEQDLVNISVKAWEMGGSKMFVREGTQVPVIDLLRGVIIQSGNDASVALAEHIAGGEDAFADVMNQTAQLLGLHGTHYMNSTGWPAEGHLTTARDLATLAQAIIADHPQYYPLYAEKYFEYNEINQPNRNRLLFRDSSVDGLKTGHTEAAGYCLVASAKRKQMRLISVVMGTTSENARAAETQKLLAYGFRYYESAELYVAGSVLDTARVWYGTSDALTLTVPAAVTMTIPRGSKDNIEASLVMPDTLKAPIAIGDELGKLTLTLNGEVIAEVPAVAAHDVDEAGFFARLIDAIKLFISNLLS